MTWDVFISYSSQDKLVADAVCHALEAAGVRCWIAPRDALAGQKYQGSIVRAIRDCRVMVLIFSSSSNRSDHVFRELHTASEEHKLIVPFRIEEVGPSDDLAYYLSPVHWLDAVTPPLEQHIHRLIETIKTSVLTQAAPTNANHPAREAEPHGEKHERKASASTRAMWVRGRIAGLAAVVVVALAVAVLYRGSQNTGVADTSGPVGADVTQPETSQARSPGIVRASSTVSRARPVPVSPPAAPAREPAQVTRQQAGSDTRTAPAGLARDAQPRLAPERASLQVGTIISPLPESRDRTGDTVHLTWSSSDQAVVSVSPAGQWTAASPGTALIVGTASGRRVTSQVTVEGGCAVTPVAGCLLKAQSAALEPYVRSAGSRTTTSVHFMNASSATIQVYWLDFEGKRKLFSTLTPGQAYLQSTLTSHAWLITDAAGRGLGIYVNSSTSGARVVHR